MVFSLGKGILRMKKMRIFMRIYQWDSIGKKTQCEINMLIYNDILFFFISSIFGASILIK